MTSDRIILNKLKSEKQCIEDKIKELTIHKSGKTYGKMLSILLYDYIDNVVFKDRDFFTYDRYREYEKVHQAISNRLGVKTKVFTREEYYLALGLAKEMFNIEISSYYLEEN